ncbi:DUF294 nucleotidyltransferase-like domain-containing protein [Sporosarcina sp. 179-K 3D1 HS]|uniref:DUF294 nucleotidyltransferase-like domain-containing protein n=1 Tax=Sporosarcina sp. 179-K 3D1 HS TaxID=3232169 RepID=UPI0039A31849
MRTIETMIQKDQLEKIHEQPFFRTMSKEDFEKVIVHCELKHFPTTEKLDYFRTPQEGLLLILKGAVHIFVKSDDGSPVVIEALQEGQLVGFSNFSYFLGESSEVLERHQLEMEIMEGSHCLQVPYSVVQQRLGDETVRDYILRKMSNRLATAYSLLGEQAKLPDDWGDSEPFVRRVQDFMKAPVTTVGGEATVQEIAQLMVDHKISSVMVVDENGRLLGIVTEKDLVQRVVANGTSEILCARDVMTKNPHTISRHDYYYEVLSAFYNYGVKHLPVVEGDRLAGVVTFSNLMSKRDRGSMGILKTIEESSFASLPVVKTAIYDVLSNLIQDEISTIHTLEIITRLYDRLARHCVKLAVESLQAKGLGGPPVPFSWYQMGSGARGEQFMLTDQDHFLVYADLVNKDREQVESYFAQLGEEIVAHLEQAGYARCKGKMMSSEAHWRGSVSDWRQRMRTWAVKPTDEDILLGYNFFSFRFLYGDGLVHKNFIEMVKRQVKSSQTFIYYMAEQEREKPIPQLNQPLLTLFRSRAKREVIDIKLHALFPMHHCLQILGIHKGIINATPLELLEGLVAEKELSAGFADEVRHAYEVALGTRIQLSWKKHLRGEDITTEIKLETLLKWERDQVRTMLDTARSLQSHLLSKL